MLLDGERMLVYGAENRIDMPITPWVLRLIVANVAVFILQLISKNMELELELIPALIASRPWTLVTYMFLHGGFGHLFFNMLGLWFFGPRLEEQVGGRRFLIIYFASGIGGALLSFLTPQAQIVGASGAIYGVLAAFAYLWPQDRIYIWGVLPVRAWLFIAIMVAMSLSGGLGGRGAVAHFAHLGGIAVGYVAVRLFNRRPRSRIHAYRAPPSEKPDVQRWTRIQRDKMHEVNRTEYDRIMEKIQEQGVASLTSNERAFLDNFSDRG